MSKRGLRIFYGAMLVLLIIPMILGVLGVPSCRSAPSPLSASAAAEATRTSHLPIIRTDPLVTPTTEPTSTPVATPVATPTASPYSAAGVLQITRNGEMNASTFNTGSFIIENTSLGGEQLTQLRIDLSTAIFRKMVFDPQGGAGDTVAKDVVIDQRVGVGQPGHAYESPRDGGYDVLVMDFPDLDKGDFVAFSVDVDPTSIKGVGAPGPAESGSVSGLELVGATVTMTFDNGTGLVGQIWRIPNAGDGGAYLDLRGGQPVAPVLEVVGQTTPAVVTAADQVVRVTGPAWQPITVLVVEGGLFTEGVPGGGHNLEPFDTNNALVFREYTANVGPGGTVDVPIALSRNGVFAGINVITAVFDNYHGNKGHVAAPIVLELHVP